MKQTVYLLSFFFLCICTAFLLPDKQITLYVIGDSTAANKKPEAYPETGWGMQLQSFFNDEVKVDNRAMNGRSTKSFINEKRWNAIFAQLKKGDYVLIEFGHNDEKLDKPGIGTTLIEYKSNLIKFVSETRIKKANPILLTPIMRRSFDNVVFVDTHLGYPAIVRKVSDSLKVPLIDMHRKTETLIKKMGEESAKSLFNYVEKGNVNYPDGKQDDTHLNPTGAKKVAGLVVEGIKEVSANLTKHLVEK